MLSESDRATLPVIATVFDKLNHEYKKYLDAEQSYTTVSCVCAGTKAVLHPHRPVYFLTNYNARFWWDNTTGVCVSGGKVAVLGVTDSVCASP